MPRRPSKISDDEMATILAYGDVHGDKAAAVEFDLSVRSIQRRRADMRSGKANRLAALVAIQKGEAVERCKDLLTDTYEATLRRYKELLPEATFSEAIEAVQVVGELNLGRQMILGGAPGEESDGTGRPHAAAPGDQSGNSRVTH